MNPKYAQSLLKGGQLLSQFVVQLPGDAFSFMGTGERA